MKTEQFICYKCNYEISYAEAYAQSSKSPRCPHCKDLLSFKNDGAVVDFEYPVLQNIFLALAIPLILFSIFAMTRHFKTVDGRALIAHEARAGDKFYGGKTRSHVGVALNLMDYSYETYWGGKVHSKAGAMINEEHWYIYGGIEGNQIKVEYLYSNSKGKKGSKLFRIPITQNTAYLDVPAIPYIKKSKPARLKIALQPGNYIRITEEQVTARPPPGRR